MSTSRRISERARVIFAGLLAIALVREIAVAQSVLEFDEWMQRIDRRSQSVQRNLARQDASAATVDAREIADLYGSMEAYFTRRGGAATAVKLSQEGKELANTVVSSVAGSNFAAATQAAQTLAKACRTCHAQYKPLD
jgi:hypothetical protein